MKYSTKINQAELNDQNKRIAFITDEFLVVGIDVGSEAHYARAFSNRSVELSGKKAFRFTNSQGGFNSFGRWVEDILAKADKKYVLVGMEPTGHYWINFGNYIKDNGMILAQVNPAAVKKSKELDDNDPTKNDRKDPKVIAGLVNTGRYTLPYMPEGIYAVLRELSNQRLMTVEQLTRIKNRLARWFSIYFPEFKEVYRNADAKTGIMVLKEYPLPEDLVTLGVEGINQIWRNHKVRGVGMKKAQQIYDAARKSIGRKAAPISARMELKNLLQDYETYTARKAEIMVMIEERLPQVSNVDKLLAMNGVGTATVVTFIAEVGDISRFSNPKQIQKLAGLSIVENSSGKHQGQYSISYRGRKRLRLALYELATSLVCNDESFAAIHRYYTTREKNQLKGMQSLIAVACKVIRVFYAILTKGIDYDGQKMTSDIVRLQAA